MKRITVLIAAMLFAVAVYGQNKARNTYHFYGGVSIGGGSVNYDANNPNITIDSLVNDAGVLKFYSGGAEVPTSGTVDTTYLSARIDSMLNKADTTTMLANYINKADTSAMLEDYINKADTASMLSKYLLITDASAGDLSASDTADMLTPYINRADTAAMLTTYINKADTAAMLATYLRAADTVNIEAEVYMLNDTVPFYTYGSFGDSTMFNKGQDNFGVFRVKQDSLNVTSLEKLRISSGDTLLFNVYYGVYQTATPVDSLFTGPQNCAYGSTSDYVPDNVTTIPPEMDVWIGLPADQPAHKPINFVMQINGKKIRE